MQLESSSLEKHIISTLRSKKVNWGPLGEQVFNRTYARTKKDGTKETWAETVVRVVDGNLSLVDSKFIEAGEREKLIDLLFNFGIIPAGRHLSCSGIKGKQFLFNCHAAGWDEKDPSAHFSFTFDQLMQGGGVGSNYSNRYLSILPAVQRKIDLLLTCRSSHPNINEFQNLVAHNTDGTDLYFFVPDTREGWVEALEILVKSAYGETPYSKIVIDVSDIRERGKPLVSSGGIACGPEPLVSMLHQFVQELNKSVGHRLQSLQVMFLDHIIASCVVAGGKRRSSRMSVKSWKDMDIFHFISCKKVDGDHWSTNISVETDADFEAAWNAGDTRAREIALAIAKGKLSNGEPGIWNRTLSMKDEADPNAMFCPNPCGEIGLHMWENCNLGHINLQYFAERPLRHVVEAFRLMTRWLVRATNGDIPQPRQRVVVDKNRRIGVGILGYHGWLALQGIKYSESWKSKLVQERIALFSTTVGQVAWDYSFTMGQPIPAKDTAIAPTGTISLIPGVDGSIQAMIIKRGKRLVRYYNMDPELALKKSQGYTTYPDKDAKNTEIVEYWFEHPLVSLIKSRGLDPDALLESQDEIGLEDSLEVQAMFQDLYANNSISYTINLPEDKLPSPEVLVEAIMKRHNRLKGTTLFVDKSRVNAPFQRVTKEQFDAYTGPKEIMQVEESCKTGCPTK